MESKEIDFIIRFYANVCNMQSSNDDEPYCSFTQREFEVKQDLYWDILLKNGFDINISGDIIKEFCTKSRQTRMVLIEKILEPVYYNRAND